MNRSLLFLIAVFIFVGFACPIGTFAEEAPKVPTKEQLAEAYAKNPNDHYINYNYCGKLIELKEYKTAIAVCTSAIETGDKNTLPWSYLNRGIAHKALGDIESAKKDRAASKEHGMRNWLLVNFLPIEE